MSRSPLRTTVLSNETGCAVITDRSRNAAVVNREGGRQEGKEVEEEAIYRDK